MQINLIDDEEMYKKSMRRLDELMELNDGEGPNIHSSEAEELGILSILAERYEALEYFANLYPASDNSNIGAQIHFSKEENQAMIRAIVNLFEVWKLTNDQITVLLGGVTPITFQRWKVQNVGHISPDLSARLSNLLGIYRALRLLYSDPARGHGWIKLPNSNFDGQTALDLMLRGRLSDLMQMREYLDSYAR